MATAGGSAGAVEQSITIHAARSTVFRFFSDPVRFARWWACPGGGKATIEPRIGGGMRIEYQGGTVACGQVVEIVENERFVMTWGFEKSDTLPPGASRVEVTLRDAPEGTLLTLRHTGLPSDQVAEFIPGWRHYLAIVAGECSKDQFGPVIGAIVGSWFEAWASTDATARRAILSRCVEDDIEFRDAFSCIRGIDTLNAHISNALKHMPGVKLEVTGKTPQMHGFVRVPWRMSNIPGMGTVTGENIYRLAPTGKIALAIGFWDGP